ncbi:Major cold shock protein CspA [Zhongshania aliphaticivorans]|uniref:Major cold shock protein CspA n=2 Tax=Zhongshania aliphaticivorans TaxID=1470434 RepID=A0A5S9QAM4_9GAMM|nr:Major cold shock protein CspA [Zhongshania aliphaticivorans]CAA0114874.1 Major cold shock protein CspA [Zhongshania aliphaticivorans]CAA0119680.1 Major cold shock protein CspA [Zhongshania aliphaticivorans]
MLLIIRIIFLAILTFVSIAALQLTGVETSSPLAVAIIAAAILLGMLAAPNLPAVADKFKSQRERGVVKWFNVSKGYGFITRDAGGDVFVHFRSIRGQGKGRRSLNEGQTVEFILTEGDKGPQAEEVTLVK